MFASTLKTLHLIFIPGGMLFALAVPLIHLAEPPEALRSLLPGLPPLVYAGGLLLGWRFNRSRLVFAVLVLALADRALLAPLHGSAREATAAAVSLLLPILLALLSLLRERGIITPWGLTRFVLILLPSAAAAWLVFREPATILGWCQQVPVPTNLFDHLHLPQPVSMAMAAALLVVLLRFLCRPHALEGGFLWAMVALMPALGGNFDETTRSLYFAASGLILAAAVIEASYGMAFRDELTGLPARRALNENLQKMGRRYALAMADIDYFKKVNDRYGHDVGDQVLKMVASKLEKVGGGGKAYRYGGEEFTILFPNLEAGEAREHLESLRESIATSPFTLRHRGRPRKKPQGKPKKKGDRRLGVTVSIGVAERSGRAPRPEQVIKAADQALYRAKKGGRNRVCG